MPRVARISAVILTRLLKRIPDLAAPSETRHIFYWKQLDIVSKMPIIF